MPDYALEASLGGVVCGIDEAGRGPWAGPVVAAAVILDWARLPAALLDGLDDSKRLPRRRREALFALLAEGARANRARIGIGAASVAEIDRHNILRATHGAMARAVARLGVAPDHALVDGTGRPALTCPAHCVAGADGRSLSVAAASIVAKVTRDRIMAALDVPHPGYGFARNAGYGTAEHRAALMRLGVTPHHRRSFAPIHKILCGA